MLREGKGWGALSGTGYSYSHVHSMTTISKGRLKAHMLAIFREVEATETVLSAYHAAGTKNAVLPSVE